ncbi:hypothetical protein FOA43_003562 [Brettanomyces nanus]|uniref:Pre-mRNA-splicing factor CLF1 n=1 Tax=Eeniella nana TaxID=13502 RepID=A0A875S4E2_EENNA|nr:uncharacterized protein FOA43_003562 [Brettanomyces nanus]QPG76176.1 hypothetical protein FOA43_003562 [Brettanomyces nanus]
MTETDIDKLSEVHSQITAEQLLSEAYEYRQTPLKTPDYKIADLDELHDFERRKRQEYEDALRRNRFDIGQWMRYAQFEVDQHDMPRARSILERALEVDNTNVSLWIRYTHFEIKGKNINHARNLLERATSVLPRVDKLWYQYVSVEENLGNVIAARAVFRKWLQWKPGFEVWRHYIEFEERYKEYDNCRLIFEKYTTVYPNASTWLYWAAFEKKHGDATNVKNVYKLGLNGIYELGGLTAEFILSWISWESTIGEEVAIRRLFEFGIKTLNENEVRKLQDDYSKFVKKYGSTQDIEDSVLNGRKLKYESKLSSNPEDFETWCLYLDLISDPLIHLPPSEIEKKFELAISKRPSSSRKDDWLPYIYVWFRYITWEKSRSEDIELLRSIYRRVIKIIPHKSFTFPKVWIGFAELEVKHNNLAEARRVLGQSMGMCPDKEVMNYYITLESNMNQFDRVRTIFNKLIENFSDEEDCWEAYVQFESQLGETERADALKNLSREYLQKPDDEDSQIAKAEHPKVLESMSPVRVPFKSRFEEG